MYDWVKSASGTLMEETKPIIQFSKPAGDIYDLGFILKVYFLETQATIKTIISSTKKPNRMVEESALTTRPKDRQLLKSENIKSKRTH